MLDLSIGPFEEIEGGLHSLVGEVVPLEPGGGVRDDVHAVLDGELLVRFSKVHLDVSHAFALFFPMPLGVVEKEVHISEMISSRSVY